MSIDHTQQQSPEELRQAKRLSLQRTQPPTDVPGYELQKFLGAGAYGEVWLGLDRNTGRRVAVKFYTHRGGVDWPLLSREVEKLVFLSADRYVVQLLDVGWDADPPYYVMEYLEHGSLEDLLRARQSLPVDEALELFVDIAIGLGHAHGKGILHCDLKPANILLDQDRKPRLADFGQSRLSHEQTPALGTLFYMAPEQADLNAVPDARWDVYALGVILYCLLTGKVPHRNDSTVGEFGSTTDLKERLARYRAIIQSSPAPSDHRQVPGVDRMLGEIIDRCLAVDPRRRFPTVASLLDALRVRERMRARRPLVVLGFVGPLLLLAIMALFGWMAYDRTMTETLATVRETTQESNQFAADAVSQSVAIELGRYFHAVARTTENPELLERIERLVSDDEFKAIRMQLHDPNDNAKPVEARSHLIEHELRRELQEWLGRLHEDRRWPRVSSWLVTDEFGTLIAAHWRQQPDTNTLGKNWSWRTYFHGGAADLKNADGTFRRPDRHISGLSLSAPFRSGADQRWKLAVSAPLFRGGETEGEFLGILALTVTIGERFLHLERQGISQYAVLVDLRGGEQRGMVLWHPLYSDVLKGEQPADEQRALFERFSQYRVDLDSLTDETRSYFDPLGEDDLGDDYSGEWIAASSPVRMDVQAAAGAPGDRTIGGESDRLDTGLLVVVQEDADAALRPIHRLGRRLLAGGAVALTCVVVVIGTLWRIVLRVFGDPAAIGRRFELDPATESPAPLHFAETMTAGPKD